MEQKKPNHYVLIVGVIAVFLVTLLVLNFGSITGNAVKKTSPTSVVQINPSSFRPGEYLNVNVIPGRDGVHEKYYICAPDKQQCTTKHRFICKGGPLGVTDEGFKCKKPFSDTYKTGSDWEPGVYTLKVFDYGSDSYIETHFTIK